ncbi:MAG: aldehyde dehydrogenase family protein [Pseudomonadota bacterium]|nr:aldehyde dehydrogenase family protein [Pseudohongiella sp.]MEC8860348.1 aldehyde dehydrogenase family protein [Pseudomonadota bacterium]|tara:strand:+ start:350391 stop:351818 length:1428 start_codon:yes stop_codon:yes gene_type:complete
MSNDYLSFYINGEWVKPEGRDTVDVINPATEQVFSRVSLGTAADVDTAAKAARDAFPAWSRTSVEERLAILDKILAGIKARSEDLAQAISQEMGAPISFARSAQVGTGLGHFATARQVLANYEFEETRGKTQIIKEPIGVCGMITPWNWPLNQLTCKVAPALATGCTMVLKPSEVAPISAMILAEIIHDAGVPAGVFNLVNGDGPGVGAAISSHPEVDMVSFTGSTRAGREVAKAAADTIKRVCQELGGKSANIILDSADFAAAVKGGIMGCFGNCGQSCNAPTRMLVPQSKMAEAIEIAKVVAAKAVPGNPADEATRLGPVVSQVQYDKIQSLIQAGIDEGATLVAGGTGKPEGLETGYFVKPTVFANVTNDMTIAREEIFGPVLSIIGYKDDEDAVRIANDTVYGLSGYVSGEPEHARAIARRMRTGMVHMNGAGPDFAAPFGGYKQSGNGREWGEEGFHDYLEIKAVMGYNA